MYRYLAFYIPIKSPKGGMRDFIDKFDNKDGCWEALKEVLCEKKHKDVDLVVYDSELMLEEVIEIRDGQELFFEQ